jgi:hypothetical protein
VLAVEETGEDERPSQRSSRSGCETSTVGLKVIGLASGGAMRTSSFEPTERSPSSFVMNGFQSGYAPWSVRIDQTTAGDASISIDRSIDRLRDVGGLVQVVLDI